MTLNLARRPFANLRPLRRLAWSLWALGGVAAIAAIWLFAAYLSGSSEKRGELARLAASTEDESQRIATLEGELERFELAAQNREVAYLNNRIAERTFAWSGLFDDLAQVLPWNVRVLSLSPLSVGTRRAGRVAGSAAGESFALRLVGSARDGEALLDFIERLFAHSSFADPNLEQERREGSEELQFTLTVTYRPRAAAVPAQFAPTAASSAGPPPTVGEVASVAVPSPPPAALPAAGAVPAPSVAAGSPAAAAPVWPGQPADQAAAPTPPATAADGAPAPSRGWAGVAVGVATTAPEPAPRSPYPNGLPLPLAPATSSSAGIR